MKDVTIVGIDLAKNVFQIHGVNKQGHVKLTKRVRREKLLDVMKSLPRSLVGLEACGGSSYWGRELRKLGHDVRLMAPQRVKPYIGGTKNDYKDAAGICEAVSRPSMLYVPIKTEEQQEIQAIHRVRRGVIERRVGITNQVRGLLGEFGIVIAEGLHHVRKTLFKILGDGEHNLSARMQTVLSEMYVELQSLDNQIKRYDAMIEEIYKQDEACQRIGKIEGIGPITATAVIAAVGDAKVFKNGRQMSAWLGLTPKQFSSGGKERLGGIGKRGDVYLRSLLVHGARAVVRTCKDKEDSKSMWIKQKLVTRGHNKTVVALANKTVRTLWAVLSREEDYRKAV